MKKPYKTIIIIFIAIILFVCWIGTKNFHLGSANYSKTAFDSNVTQWHCKELDIPAYVIKDPLTEHENCIVVSGKRNNYILRARGDKSIDISNYSKEYPKASKSATVKYKKWLGNVYAFEIFGIDNEDLLTEGNDVITFYKID